MVDHSYLFEWMWVCLFGYGLSCDNNMNNPVGLESREDVHRALMDSTEQEDLFVAYIRMIITRAPLVYMFINIILVIWIAQTIFASHLNSIPNSLYLLSPLFAATPFSRLTMVRTAEKCPPYQQSIQLKSFPTIYSDHINHQQLYGWDLQPLQFCVSEIRSERRRSECSKKEVLCSGYCVQTSNDCPITKLQIVHKTTPIAQGFEQIYQSEGKSYRISRRDGVPIVAIMAAYAPKCANDEHYNEAFEDQVKFWQQVQDCGKQGTISQFFNPVDIMQTNAFFSANGIPITTTNFTMQEVTLGVVSEFHLSSDASKGCDRAYEQANNIKNYFNNAAPAPQFTTVLLGTSFILLVLELMWLGVYYCVPQLLSQKNLVTFGISIIQLVIYGFIYSNNPQLFRLEGVTKTIKQCLQEQITTINAWDFGIQSPQAFQTLFFVNTAYLGLYVTSLLYDYFCMEPYKRRQVHLPHLALANNNNLA